MYSKPFPTHLVPSHCLYPFGGDNSVLLDSIDPLDSTRLPRLHRWIPSSPCTTQRRRVRRVLHNFVEFTLLYTTTKREVSSKGNGRWIQSHVPSLPTVALWNRRTMGSTGSPKRSTTEP